MKNLALKCQAILLANKNYSTYKNRKKLKNFTDQ